MHQLTDTGFLARRGLDVDDVACGGRVLALVLCFDGRESDFSVSDLAWRFNVVWRVEAALGAAARA